MKFAVYCGASPGKEDVYMKVAAGRSIELNFIALGVSNVQCT